MEHMFSSRPTLPLHLQLRSQLLPFTSSPLRSAASQLSCAVVLTRSPGDSFRPNKEEEKENQNPSALSEQSISGVLLKHPHLDSISSKCSYFASSLESSSNPSIEVAPSTIRRLRSRVITAPAIHTSEHASDHRDRIELGVVSGTSKVRRKRQAKRVHPDANVIPQKSSVSESSISIQGEEEVPATVVAKPKTRQNSNSSSFIGEPPALPPAPVQTVIRRVAGRSRRRVLKDHSPLSSTAFPTVLPEISANETMQSRQGKYRRTILEPSEFLIQDVEPIAARLRRRTSRISYFEPQLSQLVRSHRKR
ncbi:unnamed protein product [Dicrocoelium dendriticum]|nr:unnamed protein product [Dicrocoelium dendriticum]